MEMPTTTRIAVQLAWLALISDCIIYLTGKFAGLVSEPNFMLVITVVAVSSILPYKMQNRKNWARWFFLILNIWGVVISIGTTTLSQVDLLSCIICSIICSISCVLLFSNESNEWFRAVARS